MSDRQFPVLWQGRPSELAEWRRLSCPKTVPWSLLASNERRAQLNHGQSLETLAERGGLSPAEIMCVIEDRKLFPVTETDAEAVPRLLVLLARISLKKRGR